MISSRHTVLILFAQGNGVDDYTKNFSEASKFTSGIDQRHLDPFSVCLESQSGFQCLFLDNPLYNAAPGSTRLLTLNLSSQKPCYGGKHTSSPSAFYTRQLEMLQCTYSSRKSTLR